MEPLEACIDDINVNVKSRHIERLTTGQCTIELGFVLTDISTNFERVSDHCSNIAVYQIQVPKDEYDAHEYLQNVKHQEHAEFDREEMAYEKRYRLPDMAKAQTAEAGGIKSMIYIVEDDRNIQEIELFALKNSGYQADRL